MKIKPILVLYKKSVYDNYFLNPRSSLHRQQRFLPSKNLARLRHVHEEHYATLALIERCLKRFKLAYRKSNRGQNIDYSDYALVVTVGGDGTFLEAARHIEKSLILGVNSSPQWSVGKFCTATARDFPHVIAWVVEKKFAVKNLHRLRIRGIPKLAHVNVTNDILVAHANPSAMSRYCLAVKGIHEEQRSSGIWIATAAGSTGAIHSAGGKILKDTSDHFQYVCRELYHSPARECCLRQGILSARNKLRITSLMREGMIFVDGSRVSSPFVFGQGITIEHSPYLLRVVTA